MRIVLEHEARQRLAEQADAQTVSLATLSRVIGRGDDYLARYLRDAVPYVLNDADKRKLAIFLGLKPAELGAG